MSPDLLIPGLLVFLSLVHNIHLAAGTSVPRLPNDQVLIDYSTRAWGGPIGMTPREDPGHGQFERAVLAWAQAVAETPFILRPHGER